MCSRNFTWNFDKMNISPAGICMFKINNRNNRTMFEIFSKLTAKASERHQWGHSGVSCSAVFTVNFEQISHIVMLVSLLTLNKQVPAMRTI